MASETVSSDHPEIVEKKECEEVKTVAEVVSPPRETEEKTKDENSKVEDKSIEPPSTEEVTKTDEEKTKTAEPEEEVEEKSKAEDASEATVPRVEPEGKLKAEGPTIPPAQPKDKDLTNPPEPEVKVEVKPETEDSTAHPLEAGEKVRDKNISACQDKGEISSNVAEQVAESVESKSEEKVEIERSKRDAIGEITEDLTKKTTDVPESLIDAVIKEEEVVKEALPEKETEAAAEKDAETSGVEHTKEVTPEAVIAEEISTLPPAVTEEPEKDSADIVVKEVEAVVGKDEETCGNTVEGVELSNEKAKDVVEEPEKEKTEVVSEVKAEEKKAEGIEELVQVTKKEEETLEEKIEKADETTKPATEEVAEAISLAEKADAGINPSRDIDLLTENVSVKDDNMVEVEPAVSKGSASLGELLKPQTEEKEQENIKAGIEEEKKIEETATLHDVVKSDESTKHAEANKETSKDTPVEGIPVTKSKQSNNILTKMKQSFVKAKKAIIGKSPNSKTPSSETTAEIGA